jgi:hypothetical protein
MPEPDPFRVKARQDDPFRVKTIKQQEEPFKVTRSNKRNSKE